MKNIRMHRTIAAFLSLFCLTACLTSCQTQTVERETSPTALLSAVAKNFSKAKSYTGNISSQLNLTQDGKTIESHLSYDMECVIRPAALHLKGEISTSYEGNDEAVEIESYSIPDGDAYLLYNRMSSKWTKESLEDVNSTAIDTDLFSRLASLDAQSLTLANDWSQYNGQNVYVVKTSLSGDSLSPFLELLKGVSEATPASKETTSLQASADVELCIYADSKYPASLTILFHDEQDEIPALLGYEDTSLSALSMTYTYDDFNTLSSIDVPDEVKTAAEMNEIYNTVVEDQTSRPLERDDDGNYVLGDFYDNQYTVSIAPRETFEIDEANSGSGWIYFSYLTDQGEITGTYYLMPMTDDYGVEDITSELEYDYESFLDYDGCEATKIEALVPYEIDGREAVMDRFDFTYTEEGYHGSMRNYCMVLDVNEGLVLQCIVTEVLFAPEYESIFDDNEMAYEVLSNVIY